MDLRHLDCPVKFRRLASGRGPDLVPTFRSLKGVEITAEEKQFFCEELDDSIPRLHKFLGFTSIHMASSRYDISRRTIRNWVVVYLDPKKSFRNTTGRPEAVGEPAMLRIKKEVELAAISSKPPSSIVLAKRITQARNDDYRGRGLLPPIKSLDYRTVQKLKTSHNIDSLKPQILTLASERAMRCPRISHAWACVLIAFSAMLAPQYKWNTDATQIEIQDDGTGSLVCVVRDPDPEVDHKPVQTTLQQSNPCVFIKCGRSEEVVGLSNSSDVEKKGYLVFCKKRTGCPALWHWFFMHYVAPTLRRCREHWELEMDDGEEMRIMLSIDSEAIILMEAYSPEVQALLRKARVDFVKGPPSATGAHQACDRASMFRNTKTTNKKLMKDLVTTFCGTLDRKLKGAFRGFAAANSTVSFSSDKRKKIAHRVQCLVYILTNGGCLPKKVQRSFVVCGQQREATDENDVTGAGFDGSVDFDKVMGQCYTDIDGPSMQDLRARVPQMVAAICLHGEVTDVLMDQLGIPKLEGEDHVVRDHLVEWRKHARSISHEESQVTFVDYLRLRWEAHYPDFQAARKALQLELVAVQRLIAKRDKDALATVTANTKKVADKAARDLAKSNFDALPVAQRKAIQARRPRSCSKPCRRRPARHRTGCFK
ncbi:hypothetical protein B484DRAFT_433068 [Ochromonadaceae sp. CCMP2298]|nr:hypothetical protein B484DRAFT_433068 [Ochromonadaceae sp. CCMP2298]